LSAARRGPSLQDIVFSLQRYWSERGCLIHQPWDAEVGAGTMHPETFFRVLGPRPWRVAYVEPSVRPDDVLRISIGSGWPLMVPLPCTQMSP